MMDSKLPLIYALPKLHKSPNKFRFITGAYNSSMKPLSLELHTIFTFFKKHFINYINVVKTRNCTTKANWSIDYINISKEICTYTYNDLKIYSADFSDMFTNLEHSTILQKRCSVFKHLLQKLQ